uniref:TF-B3 domain-containing protein n=1 Tax=Leersia perrieri TaxID=77586 RepID=A0A0D9W3K7_9ORYZ
MEIEPPWSFGRQGIGHRWMVEQRETGERWRMGRFGADVLHERGLNSPVRRGALLLAGADIPCRPCAADEAFRDRAAALFLAALAAAASFPTMCLASFRCGCEKDSETYGYLRGETRGKGRDFADFWRQNRQSKSPLRFWSQTHPSSGARSFSTCNSRQQRIDEAASPSVAAVGRFTSSGPVMPSPPCVDHGGAAKVTQLKVLMPSSFRNLHISDELAAQLLCGAGAPRAAARVVSPFGKLWDVEVVGPRDVEGGRAFLGRGWPEFAAAHGLGVGWFVVLRHQGGGVLTVKVFDTTLCLNDFGASLAAAVVAARCGRSRDAPHKPQFLRILLPGYMEKMRIPDKFLQHHITEEHLNSIMAYILSPLGKVWRIELEKKEFGMFFKGGWSQFLSFHDISHGDVILLRYEGNLVFKIKVFGLNGLKKDLKTKHYIIQHNTENKQEPSSFSRSKSNPKNRRCGEDNENQQEIPCSRKGSSKKRRSGGETERQRRSKSLYQIEPPSWIMKELNKYILQRGNVSFPGTFCKSIGLVEKGIVTLMVKDSKGRCCSRWSWDVAVSVNKNGQGCCYLFGTGWKKFCKENSLKLGDVCIFNVVETTLWHVVIERS